MTASVLVVCDPEDRDELLRPLRQAGLAEVHAGDGRDDTLALCARLRPSVVVLSARLEHGDARAFLAALRELDSARHARVVLVGDADGPLRTPLDVSDLAVDHFLGRPLAPKALVYAVRTAAGNGHDPRARAGANQPEANVEASTAAKTAAETEAQPASEDSTEFELPSASGPGADTPPWREPTMILNAGGAGEVTSGRPDAPPPAPPPVGAIPDDAWVLGTREVTPLPEPMPFIDEDDDFEEFDLKQEFDLQIDEDLGADLRADLADTGERVALDAGEAASRPVTGNSFARALQRKMSAMEERLQAGRQARSAPAAGSAAAAAGPGAAAAGAGAAAAGPERGPIRRGQSDAAMLLERMYRERFTGRLVFRRRHVEKSIAFDRGRPVFATSNQPEDRLAALLAREGKISEQHAEQSYRRAVDSGKRVGEVLVELGFLKRRELMPAVRHHLEELIYTLFAWEQGEYAVIPGQFALDERIRLTSHPAAMVLEGVRRKYHGEALVTLVGPPESVVEILDDTQRRTVMSVADLSPAERRILLAFDGEHTLAEVAEKTRLGRLTVYQLAYGLVALDAARVRRPGEPRLADTQAAREGDAASAPEGTLDEPDDAELGIDRQRILAKHALVDDADYFTLLGVRRDATGFEILRAYEAARRDYAPEGLAPVLRRELTGELAEIHEVLDEAYRVLRDDGLRAAYLTHLRE